MDLDGMSSEGVSAPSSSSETKPITMRVLAIDDNFIDRKLVEMLLKTSKFEVTTCSSAVSALELLGLSKSCSHGTDRVLQFDLIMTDYCMPDMTGYQLLKRVKHESSAWKDVPVVVMSSENVPYRINRCMAEGAEEFIVKPVQLTDVKRLQGHILQAMSLKESSKDSSPSSKRKITPEGSLQVRGIVRRQRFEELAVA